MSGDGSRYTTYQLDLVSFVEAVELAHDRDTDPRDQYPRGGFR